ncbi:MAG: zinc-binding alcohol dehydrogenase [Phycisphaeraceae bacterium]|nr:zinc-binding alcohol dehydrogenase [Phycisphaeraceae bacterium]
MKTRQVFITAPRQASLLEQDLPTPNPRQALLQTRASFISAGTELSIYAALDPRIHDPNSGWNYPFKPGYANIATVVSVGAEVTKVAPGIAAGQRVFTFTPHTSHALFDLWDWDVIEPVPAELSDATAAACRMGLVAITGLQVADLALNDWVAVFGLGAVGNLAAQLFQLAGARVIAIDPVASRCELARRCGVERVIQGAGAPALESVRTMIRQAGDPDKQAPRLCVDAVGHSAILRDAVDLVATHGQVIALGSPRQPYETDMAPISRQIFGRWITITGALEWRLPHLTHLDPHARHSMQSNLRDVFDLVRRGKLRVDPLISHHFRPEQIQDAYEGLLNDKDHFHGVVLDW